MDRTVFRETRQALPRELARLGLVFGAALAAAACGPPRNLALESAQMQYQGARADPVVVEHARAELAKAGKTLDRAESAHEDGDEENAQHFSRVTETEIERARELARARRAGTQSKVVEREIERVEDQLAALQARVTERGIVLTLSDVFFEVDEAELRPEGIRNLAELAAFLRAHPDRALAIEGHADATGTDQYNQSLSERRATAVKTFLVANGVEATRVHAQGFGERFPVASNDSSQGRALNRRVEMLVLNPGETIRVSRAPIVRYHETTTITR